jgi:two-component system, OmpR family, copper resistance phosphate regulon response regulator CusR
MRALVVEDERKTAQYLKKGLSEHGFVVDVAESGEDGLHLALTGSYAFIILDVMLPGGDGWSVIRALRKNDKQTPVIFLTARDSLDDRVKGLELGADDYLVKPFAFSELLARIKTVLRRSPEMHPEMIQVGDLEIDSRTRRVTRGGKRLDLSPKEFLLLWLLAGHAGQVMTRTYISEQVWDMNFDCDTNVVDVAVRRLRRKLDDPFPLKLLHTVWGVGYVLEERPEENGR